MNEIKNLEPQIVWKNFHALTRVPRPSGHLEKVQQFLLDWAAAHGIEAFKDKGENIVMQARHAGDGEPQKSRHASPYGHGAAEDGGEPA